MNRVVIITDAWKPQTNGVVRTLSKTGACLEAKGYEVHFITPEGFRTFPCPTYPEIRLSLGAGKEVGRRIERIDPDYIHISTEGPLGLAARSHCHKRKLEYTTAYHTQFPEYVRARAPIPLAAGYAFMRWFHGGGCRTMVGTRHLMSLLRSRGFERLALWGRGVDVDLFKPRDKTFLSAPRPISMYMGRVAVEKNIHEFLDLDLPGTKFVVGDGPALEDLRKRYPNVRFTGYKMGVELAQHLAAADVFVFPSRTDTFGLVLLEAMACGVPVAAYPVTGPLDVVKSGKVGVLSDDLGEAVEKALLLDPDACREYALKHTWEAATDQFIRNLTPVAECVPHDEFVLSLSHEEN